jgi:hypothetical protein
MKRLILSTIAFLFSILMWGQESASFSYEAVIHDDTGRIVASHPVSLKISILFKNPFDTVVYSESHKVTSSELGLVTLAVGNGTDRSGDFSSVDWSAYTYFLKVEIDASGGTSYKDMGTFQILNVPYVLSSKTSEKGSNAIEEDKLFVSRKYVGKFLDYRQTGPKDNNGPNLIWIKTSMENTLGKVSAYGKKCDFSVGDKLYLKRTQYSLGGVSGYWEYQIENDSSIYYRVTNFQYDKKVSVESWFY